LSEHNTRVPEGQMMPRPWFRANNTAGPLFGIYKAGNGWERVAPLGPDERRLGSFVLPPFQRPAVWSLGQKIRFIESIWNGLPLGAYVVNRVLTPFSSPVDNWLLDGQQRITAIMDYVGDAFPIMGYRWSELTKQDQMQFGMTPMSCLETQLTDIDQLRDIYDRLAYGGTPHEPKESRFELGQQLQAARLKRGMTQAEVAAEIGVNRSDVAMWEHGDTPVDLKHVTVVRNFTMWGA
jgi:hypothetical protein